jgi:heme exporter protein D
MQEFFAMGGYAFYVWGSFGVTAVLMILEVVLLRQRKQQLLRRLGRSIRTRNQQRPVQSE